MDLKDQNYQLISKKELKFLKELVKEGVEFIIVGLSSALIQGAPVVTQDIDLWFKDLSDSRIKKALKKVDGSYIPPIAGNPPMFIGENIKQFDIVLNLSGIKDFDKEYSNGTVVYEVDGIPVRLLSLERIIHSKSIAGRQKDKAVLPALKTALKVIKGI